MRNDANRRLFLLFAILMIISMAPTSMTISPLYHAAIIAFSLTFILVLTGVFLRYRIFSPLFQHLHFTSKELLIEIEWHQKALVVLRESEMRFLQRAKGSR